MLNTHFKAFVTSGVGFDDLVISRELVLTGWWKVTVATAIIASTGKPKGGRVGRGYYISRRAMNHPHCCCSWRRLAVRSLTQYVAHHLATLLLWSPLLNKSIDDDGTWLGIWSSSPTISQDSSSILGARAACHLLSFCCPLCLYIDHKTKEGVKKKRAPFPIGILLTSFRDYR